MSNDLQHNATLNNGLSPAKQVALAALLAGQTVTAAAQAANVNRTTIYRWLHDPCDPFGPELERGKHELRQAIETRLLTFATRAADCVEQSLRHGDTKAALALLKGLGFLSASSRKM